MTYKEIFNILSDESNKKIAVFTHINPDGDCLGSAASLYYALKQLGKDVQVFAEKDIHQNFSFLIEDLFNPEMYEKYDLLVAVDSSDITRIGDYSNMFSKHKNTLMIDHHKSAVQFAKYNYIEETACSCCEILYKILNSNMKLNLKIAQALYCGILTDTGCFVHNNTTPLVHTIAADLLSYGLDIDTIHYYLMKRRTIEELNLLGTALSSLKLELNGQVSIMTITVEDFLKTNTTEKNVIGLVNYGVGIDNVKYSILISEIKKNVCKISIRSKLDADSSQVCEAFGGGGHKFAAGCKIIGKPENVKIKILNICRSILCLE